MPIINLKLKGKNKKSVKTDDFYLTTEQLIIAMSHT